MSEEAQAPAGGGLEVEPEDVKSSKSDTPKTESKESKSQPKSETKSSDGKSESKQEAKDAGPAPWANDLAERGLDDPRIDQYLREVWQPRMTQFEQDLAGWSDLFGGDMEAAQIMAGLAEALDSDPEGTYQQMGELLGLSGDIGEYDEFDEAEHSPTPMDYDDDEEGYEDSEEGDEYRDWVMSKMMEEQEAQQDAAYEDLLVNIEQQVPGFDRDLFHAAIVAFEGDPDSAMEWYMKYHRAPEAPAEMDGPDPVGEGTSGVPNKDEYSNLGSAIDAFLSEDRTSRSTR